MTNYTPDTDGLSLAELRRLAQESPDRAVRRRATSRIKRIVGSTPQKETR